MIPIEYQMVSCIKPVLFTPPPVTPKTAPLGG